MFRLYHSNDLEILKELLLNEIRQNPPGVFEAEQILVQSQGMAHWLKLQLADGLGVAAQVDFPLPSAYVWKVFNTLKPELPERSHFEKQAMAWKLMRLLPGLKDEPECEGIARYLKSDPDELTNLAKDPKHAAKLKQMEALLLSEMKRLDDPYRLWDQEAK